LAYILVMTKSSKFLDVEYNCVSHISY
jgi:hypothetical protein